MLNYFQIVDDKFSVIFTINKIYRHVLVRDLRIGYVCRTVENQEIINGELHKVLERVGSS